MHSRQAIRQAAIALLDAAPALAGRVKASRVYPIDQDAELPVVLVYTLAERIERDTLKSNARTLDLVVAIKATASEGLLDDALDVLAEVVEVAMVDLQGQAGARDVALREVQAQLEGTADRPVGAMALVYEVRYRTAFGAPGSAL